MQKNIPCISAIATVASVNLSQAVFIVTIIITGSSMEKLIEMY